MRVPGHSCGNNSTETKAEIQDTHLVSAFYYRCILMYSVQHNEIIVLHEFNLATGLEIARNGAIYKNDLQVYNRGLEPYRIRFFVNIFSSISHWGA